MRSAIVLAVSVWVGTFVVPTLALSGETTEDKLLSDASKAQIIFLGEQHDNAAHHNRQAAWVAALEPSALVFEMLTGEQAAAIQPKDRNDATRLAEVTGWEASGWPDFSMYYPIFAAAPEAQIYGAGVPPSRVRGLMSDELDEVAGDLTQRFALNLPLPALQQEAREALQMAAHCDALPEEMLPMMVSVQRLRDAFLAGAALDALAQTGGPVVVITGNGHAREDWGAPFMIRASTPELSVFTLGQGEAGQTPEGGFGAVLDGPAVDRGDPCDAFR